MLRFAPSPTGHLHIGNMRIALMNYIHAIHSNKKFFLRIDSTDKSRNIENHGIISDLQWLGIEYDAIFEQSKRIEIYNKYLSKLENMVTVESNQYVLNTEQNIIHWHDQNYGAQSTPIPEKIVLTRSDGTALYNFASIVDDIDMGITHIIRGMDHITNTGIQLYIAQCIGIDIQSIQFTHLPLIVSMDGTPLSKRDGDTSTKSLMDAGFDANAFISYIMSMNATTTNIYNGISDITEFGMPKFTTTPPKWDMEKLVAIQHALIQQYDYPTNSLHADTSLKKWQLIQSVASNWLQIYEWEKILNQNIETRHSIEEKINDKDDLPALMKKYGKKHIRLALTGKQYGPSLNDIINTLTIQQIKQRINKEHGC